MHQGNAKANTQNHELAPASGSVNRPTERSKLNRGQTSGLENPKLHSCLLSSRVTAHMAVCQSLAFLTCLLELCFWLQLLTYIQFQRQGSWCASELVVIRINTFRATPRRLAPVPTTAVKCQALVSLFEARPFVFPGQSIFARTFGGCAMVTELKPDPVSYAHLLYEDTYVPVTKLRSDCETGLMMNSEPGCTMVHLRAVSASLNRRLTEIANMATRHTSSVHSIHANLCQAPHFPHVGTYL